MNKETVVFIGAGNVATHLSQNMKYIGYRIRQVYSRSFENAKALAEQLKCRITTNLKAIKTDADLYIFAIPDDALPAVLAEIPPNNGLWIHTSGSVPMDVFHGFTERYGVLYPLQTFSKQRDIDFSEVPLFIEANSFDDNELLYDLAGGLSNEVKNLTSEKRKYLHLAAVFACNFSNRMYSIAAQLLEKQGVDWRLLRPLIAETAFKLYDMSPDQAQTGPAVRGDHNIILQHKAMLEDETLRTLYSLISENIHTQYFNKRT